MLSTICNELLFSWNIHLKNNDNQYFIICGFVILP